MNSLKNRLLEGSLSDLSFPQSTRRHGEKKKKERRKSFNLPAICQTSTKENFCIACLKYSLNSWKAKSQTFEQTWANTEKMISKHIGEFQTEFSFVGNFCSWTFYSLTIVWVEAHRCLWKANFRSRMKIYLGSETVEHLNICLTWSLWKHLNTYS